MTTATLPPPPDTALVAHATRTRRRIDLAVTLLWTLVAGLLAMYLIVFGLCAVGRLAHPLDEFTYGESWLLDGARRVARGEALYGAADQLPLTQTAYTPLYYLAVGGLQRVFGESGYTLGRCLSLVAMLAAALLLAWSVRRLTGRWSMGWLAGGFFLTQNLTALLWAPMHRVDPLALAFTVGALALATAGRSSLAGLACLLALATKQTYLVAPLAICLAQWPSRRNMAVFASLVGGGGLLGFSVAEWLTSGWFAWHTLVANDNGSSFETFASLMGSFLQFNGLPVLAACGSLLLPARRGERLWRLYFVGTLLTLPTTAKLGASSNYWLEPSAATAAVLALASHQLSDRLQPISPPGRLVAPLVLAGALLIAVPGYQATMTQVRDSLRDVLRPPEPAYLSLVGDGGSLAPYRVDTRFVQAIRAEPGALLTDNSGLAVAAGKPIAFEFQIFQLLEAQGHWSEQPILDAIMAQRFALVALMHPLDAPVTATRWTPAIRDALLAEYAPAGSQAGFWLYRPRR